MIRIFYHAQGDAQDVRNLRVQVWQDRPSGSALLTPTLTVRDGEEIATRLSEAFDLGIGPVETFCPMCRKWHVGRPAFHGANRPRTMCAACKEHADILRRERENRHCSAVQSDPLRGIRTIHLGWSSWYKRVRAWKAARTVSAAR